MLPLRSENNFLAIFVIITECKMFAIEEELEEHLASVNEINSFFCIEKKLIKRSKMFRVINFSFLCSSQQFHMFETCIENVCT